MLGLYKTHKSPAVNLLIGISQLAVYVSAVMFWRAKIGNLLYEKLWIDKFNDQENEQKEIK